ncbi:MAG: hypothetical protein WAN36_03500 [Calditrichia bacterium]
MIHEDEKENQSTERYEEYSVVSQTTGWIIIFAFTALILCWAVFVMVSVPDVPRQWDFGSLPDTPAKSVYSSAVPADSQQVPQQFPVLPEAEPLEAPEK